MTDFPHTGYIIRNCSKNLRNLLGGYIPDLLTRKASPTAPGQEWVVIQYPRAHIQFPLIVIDYIDMVSQQEYITANADMLFDMTYQIRVVMNLTQSFSVSGKTLKGEHYLEYLTDQVIETLRTQRSNIPRVSNIRITGPRPLPDEMDKDIMTFVFTIHLSYNYSDSHVGSELKLWRNPITFHIGTTAYDLTKWANVGGGGTYTPITQIDRCVGTAAGVDYLFVGTTDYILTGTTIDWTPAGTDPDDNTVFYVDYRYTET